ncbi:alpha/beta fold hydrolase [Chryseobacterium sp. BIGb0232]|uniref:alpha/beta fold hydrolase n=1 Tax=Chryseobacterium sp. BIGb0232 TaxID=2940598 RepID=UPI000FAB3D1F|nr:alpha/beta hydrolase [Chryseobacterium sp. BIGb0232]MCS4302678.1 pimeloyl-ACP methyl ester carboxylesterase [Chryseobacterium sp. BIGb0232]ROS17332.1 pimeloyl-ACP methyl ester carboxylesterase [Chryseobacterium nakagawai]
MQRATDKYLSKKTGYFNFILSRTLLVFTIITLSIKMNAQTKLSTSTSREEYIEVEKNVKLHVTDLGNGPAVVLIHGLPLNDAMFEYQYQELVEKGFRVIGITLRGFGKSSKPFGQYNYDVFADDIEEVIKKLKLENVTLGGFSMGGAIAIHYVAKFGNKQVSKLALFGAAAPIWTQRSDYPYGLRIEDLNGLIALSKNNRPLLLQNISTIFGASETSISSELSSWLFSINMEASPYATTQGLIALRDTDLRPELIKITIPTVIFHGTQDKIAEFALAEQMHQGIKGSKLVKFEKSGHGLFIEELEKFNTEFIAFLKQ